MTASTIPSLSVLPCGTPLAGTRGLRQPSVLLAPLAGQPCSPCSLSNANCQQCVITANIVSPSLNSESQATMRPLTSVSHLAGTSSCFSVSPREKTYGKGTGLLRGVSSSPRSPRDSLRPVSLHHCCCYCAREDAVHAFSSFFLH